MTSTHSVSTVTSYCIDLVNHLGSLGLDFVDLSNGIYESFVQIIQPMDLQQFAKMAGATGDMTITTRALRQEVVHVPAPEIMVWYVGISECLGGVLLVIGFCVTLVERWYFQRHPPVKASP